MNRRSALRCLVWDIQESVHTIVNALESVLYNQTVRAINSYHSVKTAQLLLEKLENLSLQIIMLQQKTIQLTEQFDRR